MTDRQTLIKYRWDKARETLEDARILLESGRVSSAVNRIYYAAFYGVCALLQTRDLSSPKHSGVRALFNTHFVKKGTVPKEAGRFFTRIFEFRQKNDYEDFITFEPERVRQWLDEANRFLDIIEPLLGPVV